MTKRIIKTRKIRNPLKKRKTGKRKYNKKTRGGNPDEVADETPKYGTLFDTIYRLNYFCKKLIIKRDINHQEIIPFFEKYGKWIFTSDKIDESELKCTLFEDITSFKVAGVTIVIPFQNQKLFNVFFYTESQIEEILESTKKKNTGYGFIIDTFKSSAMNFFKEIKSGGKILIDLFKKLQYITINYETYPWTYKIKEVIKLSIDGTPFLKLLDTLAITALDENGIKCKKGEVEVLNVSTQKPIGCASINLPEEEKSTYTTKAAKFGNSVLKGFNDLANTVLTTGYEY